MEQLKLFTFIFCLSISLQTYAADEIIASFDCNKASQAIEKSICSDSELAELDRKMADAYKNKRQSITSNEKTTLKQEQREWLSHRAHECEIRQNNYNSDAVINCLVNSYKYRIEELKETEDERMAFYRNSATKNQFTLNDRKKWKKLVKWPDSCEFEKLEYMSDSGIEFININNDRYILKVLCNRFAYQSENNLYLVNFKDNTVHTVPLKITQITSPNHSWKKVKSNKIVGHLQYYPEDKSFLFINKFSGAGQCGYIINYKLNLDAKSTDNLLKIISARGNNNCSLDINMDSWPDIKEPIM